MDSFNEDLQLAVKRGAYYLDNQFPNWATAIDLGCLEMDDCEYCIVGQAIGDYGTAIANAAGCDPYTSYAQEWAIENGFDISEEMICKSKNYGHNEYKELETLWTDQVRDRLGAE